MHVRTVYCYVYTSNCFLRQRSPIQEFSHFKMFSYCRGCCLRICIIRGRGHGWYEYSTSSTAVWDVYSTILAFCICWWLGDTDLFCCFRLPPPSDFGPPPNNKFILEVLLKVLYRNSPRLGVGGPGVVRPADTWAWVARLTCFVRSSTETSPSGMFGRFLGSLWRSQAEEPPVLHQHSS